MKLHFFKFAISIIHIAKSLRVYSAMCRPIIRFILPLNTGRSCILRDGWQLYADAFWGVVALVLYNFFVVCPHSGIGAVYQDHKKLKLPFCLYSL